VDVWFDQAGHHRPSAQVDHARTRTDRRGRVGDRGESTVANRHGARHRIARVHRVDAAVDQNDLFIGIADGRRGRRCLRKACGRNRRA
jgi:hypothetical protein